MSIYTSVVNTTTYYKYTLIHPIAPVYLEITLLDEKTKKDWEPYLVHFQEWLKKQREKANPPL